APRALSGARGLDPAALGTRPTRHHVVLLRGAHASRDRRGARPVYDAREPDPRRRALPAQGRAEVGTRGIAGRVRLHAGRHTRDTAAEHETGGRFDADTT